MFDRLKALISSPSGRFPTRDAIHRKSPAVGLRTVGRQHVFVLTACRPDRVGIVWQTVTTVVLIRLNVIQRVDARER